MGNTGLRIQANTGKRTVRGFGLLGLLGALLLLPGGLSSTSYMPSTFKEKLDGADLVFAGRVVSVKDVDDGEYGWTHVKFEVNRVFKNRKKLLESAVTLSATSATKAICSIYVSAGMDGTVRFRVGDEALLLCYDGRPRYEFPVGGAVPYTFFLRWQKGAAYKGVFNGWGGRWSKPIKAVEKGDIIKGDPPISSELFFRKVQELLKPE